MGKIEKIVLQFKAVKKYAFDILMGNEMNRTMRVIKQQAIEETAVGLTCHGRFTVSKLQKHN